MLAEYKTRASVGIALGVPVLLIGSSLKIYGNVNTMFLHLIQIAGVVSFVYGCWAYAKGKGYHGAWGLLGLGMVFGLMVLALMPDKHKQKKLMGKRTKLIYYGGSIITGVVITIVVGNAMGISARLIAFGCTSAVGIALGIFWFVNKFLNRS